MGSVMSRRTVIVVAIVMLLAVACGSSEEGVSADSTSSSPPTTAPPSTSTSTAPVAGRLQAPPAVTVQGAGDPIELKAWTYCFRTGCADGAPPETPPDVGATDQVTISFPLDDWTFEAGFARAGVDCARQQSVALERSDDGSFVVEPAGRAGTYDVTLTGQGEHGDLFVTFRWTTRTDGPLATPEARTAVLADHDGVLDSYGVELYLSNLAATPTEASATITLRSADGVERTLTPTRATGCRPEGSVAWNGPNDAGKEAAEALGRGPYTYEVEVTLDGVVHRATATWPDDVVEGEEPSVPLTFAPPLPALS